MSHSQPTIAETIADDMRAAILSGEIPPGGRLPSENELAERYQVQRLTVRRALRKLVEQHLIINRPRRGNFAVDHISRRWDLHAQSGGELPATVTTAEPGDLVAGRPLDTLLDFRGGDLAMCRTVTHRAADVPLMVAADYVPYELAQGTPLMHKAPADAAAELAVRLGAPDADATAAEREMNVRPPTDAEVSRLDLSTQTVLEVVHRTLPGADGRFLLVSHRVYRTGPGITFTY